MYGVDLDKIALVNRLSDAAKIEAGRLIFIPSQKTRVADFDNTSEDGFIWPLKGEVIAAFGKIYNNMINKGINIKPRHNLNVLNSRDGEVVFYSNDLKSYGRTIIIDHQDGFLSVYSRNSKIYVKTGDYVKQGEVIAKVGSTIFDKEDYLHFEIRDKYGSKNPILFLP